MVPQKLKDVLIGVNSVLLRPNECVLARGSGGRYRLFFHRRAESPAEAAPLVVMLGSEDFA